MGEKRNERGIAPTTVAQLYERPDKRWTFRYHDGTRYRYARSLAGNDLGWPTLVDTQRAARGFGIRNTVEIDAR